MTFTWARRGSADLFDSGFLPPATTHLTPPIPLPADTPLWARVWTRQSGVWRFADSQFSLSHAAAAALAFPRDGTTNVALSPTFTWTSTPGAAGYALHLGTIGGQDVYDTGPDLLPGTAVSLTVPSLPPNTALRARLRTRMNGVWRYRSDVVFSTGGAPWRRPPHGRSLPLDTQRRSGGSGRRWDGRCLRRMPHECNRE